MSAAPPDAAPVPADETARSLALTGRLRVLTGSRIVLAAAVVALALALDPLTADGRLAVLLAATGVYVVVHLVVFLLLRRLSGGWVVLRDLTLVVDALWGIALLWTAGGPLSPLLGVVELQVVAVTVLFGWSAGVRLALLDTISLAWLVLASSPTGGMEVLIGSLPVQVAPGLAGGDPVVVPGIAAAASLWVLAVGTGYFTSVNERDLRRSNRELSVLRELNTELERSLELSDVSEAIARGLVAELGYDRAVVWMPDESGDLQAAGAAGFDDDDLQVLGGLQLRVRVEPVRETVDARRPRLIARTDPRPASLADAFEIDSPLVLVPLMSEGRLLGLVSVEVPTPVGRAPQVRGRELRILATLATEAALALDNARLHAELRDLSVTDALTGVYNHRYFQQRLQEELDRSMRQSADGTVHPVSLILLDIDFFKRVNDRFGHPSGDELLRSLARLISRVLRSTDIVCRYGGEEFGIVLPETDATAADVVAERLREAIERSGFVGASGRGLGPVTASFGVATHHTGVPSRNDLIARADQALYRAKEGGRNQVVRADGPRRTGRARVG